MFIYQIFLKPFLLLKIVKLVIPMAGKGVRLRPHTYSKPKPFLAVSGEPLISHVLKTVEKLPIDEAIFIVGEFSEKLITYLRKRCDFKTRFIKQKKPKGIAHAVYGAKPYFKENEEIIILFSDTIFQPRLKNIKPKADGYIWVSKVKDPSKFGVCFIQNGFITRLVEKPKVPLSNLAAIGLYYLKSADILFSVIKELFSSNIKTHGEYQLTDALQLLIQRGLRLEALEVKTWLDCGTIDGLLKANNYLLKTSKKRVGKVYESLIIEPVFIGKNTSITKSIIGPNVSIGNNSIVNNSIINESIIGSSSIVENSNINSSIIGDNAIVRQEFRRLNIGDSSEVFYTSK